MAQAKNSSLPIFYKELVALNSEQHGDWSSRALPDASFAKDHHAVPLTSDEFVQAARVYPIVFSASDKPVPLALMGMNEGVNTFIDEEGKIDAPTYLPAYIRRYPFMLAKVNPDRDELSLCFDPSWDSVGKFDEGDRLFDDDKKPSEMTQNILKFCEQFEQSGARTQQFVEELVKLDLLMDGEVGINMPDREQPYVYRGFKMVNEEKLRELRGDELRKMNKNGMLPLIYAHLFSLQLMREIFARQHAQGRLPELGQVGESVQ